VRTVLQNRLAGRVRIRHDRGIDVDHDLISLARSAGIDAMVERRFRKERQRVGLLLGPGGWIVGNDQTRSHGTVGARSRGNVCGASLGCTLKVRHGN
jgi:hypothetical protein